MTEWILKHVLLNFSHANATELDRWEINVRAGDGLVPSGSTPMLTQTYVVTRQHWFNERHVQIHVWFICLKILRILSLKIQLTVTKHYRLWFGALHAASRLLRQRSFSSLTHMMTSSNGNIFRVTGPLCGEFTSPGKFPTQRPVTRSFDVFFDLRLNKRLSKQPWGWWFETPSRSLWRHRNDICVPELHNEWKHGQ